MTCIFGLIVLNKFFELSAIFPVFSRNFLNLKRVYKELDHLIFSHYKIFARNINTMTDETGIRDMSGSINPQFTQTLSIDDPMENDAQPLISNSQLPAITHDEMRISDSDDPNPIIPPFPETQPTDAWIEDEDQPRTWQSQMSYSVPDSFKWSPLTHQRSYQVRSIMENLTANISYLVFELEKLRLTFPIDMTREDAHKEQKSLERSVEKFRQMTRQVRKLKREIIGMLEDGVYVNPRDYDRSKFSTAATHDFQIQE